MKKENIKMFNCRVCGKAYNTLEEANQCETSCLAKEKIEKETFDKNKRLEEIDRELEEIYEKEESIEQLIESFETSINELENELTKIGDEIRILLNEKRNLTTTPTKETYIINGKEIDRDTWRH